MPAEINVLREINEVLTNPKGDHLPALTDHSSFRDDHRGQVCVCQQEKIHSVRVSQRFAAVPEDKL